jgi:hypothetical protein
MRVNVMFGLGHVKDNEVDYEAIRLLESLAEQLTNKAEPIKVGDVLIIRDINGNRVGVADILEDRS